MLPTIGVEVMRTFVIVLLVFSSGMMSASFTQTDPVSTATPTSLGDDVRVSVPYDGTTEVRELRDSDVNLTISVVTNDTANKTYYINLEESQIYKENIEYILEIDGNTTNATVETHLEQEWTKFETDKENFTVTIQPQGVGSADGFLAELQALLFGSPVTLLLVSGFVLFLTFAGYQFYAKESEKMYVN
jgi:hypothetical protein